jgi:hypothetical protein
LLRKLIDKNAVFLLLFPQHFLFDEELWRVYLATKHTRQAGWRGTACLLVVALGLLLVVDVEVAELVRELVRGNDVEPLADRDALRLQLHARRQLALARQVLFREVLEVAVS